MSDGQRQNQWDCVSTCLAPYNSPNAMGKLGTHFLDHRTLGTKAVRLVNTHGLSPSMSCA